jgi:CubicO group peptidase (beta-lactamase class C family)
MRFISFILFFLLNSCGGDSSQDKKVVAISELTKQYRIPGLAVAFQKGGVRVDEDFSGIRKEGFQNLIQESDAFHLGSCSKAMTATLVGILIDEKKLNWDASLKTLLPDLSLDEKFQDMTFETLLVHRAGLPVESDFLFGKVRTMDPSLGRELITSTLLKSPPLSEPDSTFTYSNFNYIIAGRILERLTQKSWENLINEKLFSPLGMTSCGFGTTSVGSDIAPSSVWAHTKLGERLIPLHYDNPLAYGPSSTIHCTLKDWGKFLDLHAKGFRGESSFLSQETFRKLYATHPSGDSTYTYGGWIKENRKWANGVTLSHTGSNTFNYANVWIAPNLDAIVMSVANRGGNDAFLATVTAIQGMIQKHLVNPEADDKL